MYPILLRIGGIPIYAHGFFFLLGLLVGLALLLYEARRRRWPKRRSRPHHARGVRGRHDRRVSFHPVLQRLADCADRA